LQAAGILWAIASKIVLGRSFGWLPADRGIVSAGPYRIVRHPVYFGYLITHVGFLSANLNWQNLLVYASLYVAQIIRIFREERLLMQNATYRAYAEKVRYRLIYGVF
jgi:protein-S-isoprenylcysteine O-methyltransferase Ste14